MRCATKRRTLAQLRVTQEAPPEETPLLQHKEVTGREETTKKTSLWRSTMTTTFRCSQTIVIWASSSTRRPSELFATRAPPTNLLLQQPLSQKELEARTELLVPLKQKLLIAALVPQSSDSWSMPHLWAHPNQPLSSRRVPPPWALSRRQEAVAAVLASSRRVERTTTWKSENNQLTSNLSIFAVRHHSTRNN